MIDLLIQMFGPTLANKFFASNGPTTEDLTAALSKLAEDTQRHNTSLARLNNELKALPKLTKDAAEHAKALKRIEHELSGLTPHNLNPRIDEIYDWTHRHTECEQKNLRELAQKQLYWNVALSCGAGLALLFSILCLVK